MQNLNLIRKRIIKWTIRLLCLFLIIFLMIDAFWLFKIKDIDIEQINAEYHTKLTADGYFYSGAHRGLLLFKDEPTYTFKKFESDNIFFIKITHNNYAAQWPIMLNQPRLYKSEKWNYKNLSITADIMIHEDNILNDDEYVPFRIEYSFHYLDTYYFIEKTNLLQGSISVRPLSSGILSSERKEIERLIDEIIDFT